MEVIIVSFSVLEKFSYKNIDNVSDIDSTILNPKWPYRYDWLLSRVKDEKKLLKTLFNFHKLKPQEISSENEESYTPDSDEERELEYLRQGQEDPEYVKFIEESYEVKEQEIKDDFNQIMDRNDLDHETMDVLNRYYYYELYDIINYENYENYSEVMLQDENMKHTNLRSKRIHVAITEKGGYLGHVYTWEDELRGKFISMIGIRSSIMNLIDWNLKGMAKRLINSVLIYARSRGFKRVCAQEPIGPMPQILSRCGFWKFIEPNMKKAKYMCISTTKEVESLPYSYVEI